MSKSTILDICRETGFSVATVSRVINKSPKVKDETRATVLEAIERAGFTPNAAARNLVGQKANAIGVMFHQMTSGFYANVMSGVQLEARALGYHVLITLVHHEDPDRACYFDMLNEARVDGLIILDSTLNDETIKKLKSYNRPIVLIQKTSEDPLISTMCSANEDAAYEALSHLLDLGYENILLIAGPSEAEDSNLRMEGCRRAFAERGMKIGDVILGSYSAHDAVEAFKAYRDEKGLPRAIFSFNDEMALAMMKELRQTGVKVPEQVAIVGFDGLAYADYMGLTTMQMPMWELGGDAVRLLIKQIESPDTPAQHVTKSCHLAIRETCGGVS